MTAKKPRKGAQKNPAPHVKLSSNTGSAFVLVRVPGAGLGSGQHVFYEKPLGAPCEVHAADNVVGAESCQAYLPAAASESEHVGPTERGHRLSLLSMGRETGPGHLLHSGGSSGTQVVGHTPCHPIRTLVQLTSPVQIGGRGRVDVRDAPPVHLLTRAPAAALVMNVCVCVSVSVCKQAAALLAGASVPSPSLRVRYSGVSTQVLSGMWTRSVQGHKVLPLECGSPGLCGAGVGGKRSLPARTFQVPQEGH